MCYTHKKFKTGIKRKFNQDAWLKSYVDINTDLKSKKWFWKRFFKLMNNVVFGKTMENMKKPTTSLVFMWNSAQRVKFDFYFSRVFF